MKMLVENVWNKFRIPIISVFVLFHMLTIILWITPPFPMYFAILPPFRHYICLIGFWNTWTMFSHPKKWNGYLTANVILANGQTEQWNFPRMDKLDYFTRAQKERYRKWEMEYVNEDEYKFVLPEACRFVARQVASDTKKPAAIQLTRHWTWIQPPPGMGESLPTGEQQYAFFTYNLQPGDLQ